MTGEKDRAFEVCLRTREDLSGDGKMEEFLRFVRGAHLVIMHFMGGKKSFPGYSRCVAALEGTGIPVHIQGTAAEKSSEMAELSTVGGDHYQSISCYINYGGEENYRNLLCYISTHFAGIKRDYAEPQRPQWQGIYHPDFDHSPELEEYLEKKYISERPTAGLWFYQSIRQSGNTEFIDMMIREIEGRGANVIPVFLYSTRDADLGSEGVEGTAERYFMKDGKPLIDVIISPLMFSISMKIVPGGDGNDIIQGEDRGLLKKLGVPAIKAIVTQHTLRDWQDSPQGLTPGDVTMSVVMPEFDGMLITVPVAAREHSYTDTLTGARITRYVPIPERIEKLVSLSLNWAWLRYIPNNQKKVAVIFHNYPPRNDKIGNAFGLDSPASVWNLLHRMREEGYSLEYLPESGQTLIEDIINGTTNDRRYTSTKDLAQKAAGQVSQKQYDAWFRELPPETRQKMTDAWGKPPGSLFNYQNSLFIPGLLNGNVFIGLQPPRGFGDDPSAIYHSPDHPVPHHYYAYYRWIRDVFMADVIMHIGKHGSLEWLPGKSVGLSDACFPDVTISDLPNIYPYIINNPGEGTQAKRRSYCCIIDHLPPVMHNADAYEEMSELQVLLNNYYQAGAEDSGKLPELRKTIWEKVCQANLDHDLKTDENSAFTDYDAFLEKLHEYLHEMADTQIRDGLHIMGEPPVGERLDEFLVALTRLSNGDVPSLRQALAEMRGYDYDHLLANRGRIFDDNKSGGQIIDELHRLSLRLVKAIHAGEFREDKIDGVMDSVLGANDTKVKKVLSYLAGSVAPNLAATTDEIDNTLKAAAGCFVPPGPSGAPTRGMADILPTGRNFYSIDPQAIPSPSAWKTGMSLGDALLERYLKDEGKYPESIGIVVWGTGTMRTKGDDIAEILYLMGVRPVWQPSSGRVKDIEVIPLAELGRPRIDVTLRVSGLFRDAFPNIINLIDNAVQVVSSLKEQPDMNYLAAHVMQEIEDKKLSGVNAEQAEEEARYRVFSCKPGAYGAGVSNAIEAKNWQDEKDLGEVYLVWGGYAYTRKNFGVTVPAQFKHRLSQLDVTVKNEDNREHDMLDSDDFYSYHGGMIAAVKAFKGELPQSYSGNSSDPDRVKMRTAEEETKHIFRVRILNPKWIQSMKRHGYKGAADFSAAIDNAFGWDASAEVLEDWMYEEMANKYALDKDMQDWLKDVNPYALQNITERLLEAIQRGMWQATEEMNRELRNIYLDIEGTLEDAVERNKK